MLPMLALAIGPTLARLVEERWFHRVALGCAVIVGIACVLGGTVIDSGRWQRIADTLANHGLDDDASALSTFFLVVGGVVLAMAAVLRARNGVPALLGGRRSMLGGLASIWLLWGLWAAPLINDDASSAAVMRRADEASGPAGEMALVGWKEQNLLMAPRRPVDFGFNVPVPVQLAQAVRWQAQAPDRRWIFAPRSAVESCVDESLATNLGKSNRRQWWLFPAAALRRTCPFLQDSEAAASADRSAPYYRSRQTLR